MLVLSRRVGEEIVIADRVRVRVAAVRGKSVQLAFAAPDSVRILRQEIYALRQSFGCGEASSALLPAEADEADQENWSDPQLV